MLTDSAREELRRLLGERVRFDEPLRGHTSFRIGDLRMCGWRWPMRRRSVGAARGCGDGPPVVRDRRGTNMLVSDRGVRGIVLHPGRPLAAISWQANGRGIHVRAGSAAPFKKLVNETIARGLAGLEFAEGIPGSVGEGC